MKTWRMPMKVKSLNQSINFYYVHCYSLSCDLNNILLILVDVSLALKPFNFSLRINTIFEYLSSRIPLSYPGPPL